MICALISDIHANVDALRRVLADAKRSGAEKIICLGDIVGYGPLPRESLRLVRDNADIVLAGNHDDAVSGRMNDADFIDLAGEAVHRHRAELSKDELAFLAALPYTASLDGAVCTHGDVTDPAAFNYIDSDSAAKANFKAFDEQILFVGHTHVPEIRVIGLSGTIHTLPPQDFVAETGKRYIVNVGSVGYPRESKGECYSSYVLYESESRTIHYRFLPFAVASLLQRGGPRSYRKRPVSVLIGLITALLLGLGAVFFLLSTPPDNPTPSGRTESIPPPPAQPAPLAEKVLYLSPSQHHVHANLRLERGSPGAHLTINFEDSKGHALTPLAEIVPNSSRKAFPAPLNTVKATFEIRALVNSAPPQIKSFAPSAD